MVSLGIFSLVLPRETCALRSTQPQKVSTRDFSWDKGGRYVWLTTYHSCSAETSRKSGAVTYPKPLGSPRPVAGHRYFLLIYIYIYIDTYSYIQLKSIVCLVYEDQQVSALWGSSCCLLSDSYETGKYCKWVEYRVVQW